MEAKDTSDPAAISRLYGKRDSGPEPTKPPWRVPFLLVIERLARRIEVRIVIANPRRIVAFIEIRPVGRRARHTKCGFLHLIIGVAIMPKSMGRLLWGGEDRAREGCDQNSESAKSFHGHGSFSILLGELSLRTFPAVGMFRGVC